MAKNTKSIEEIEPVFTGMEDNFVEETVIEEKVEETPTVTMTADQIQEMIDKALKADRKASAMEALAKQEAEADVKKGKFARPDYTNFIESVKGEALEAISLSPLLAQEVGTPFSFCVNGRVITLRVNEDTMVPTSVAKYWKKKVKAIEQHAIPVNVNVAIN